MDNLWIDFWATAVILGFLALRSIFGPQPPRPPKL
jgi:hypothetical protein